MASPVVGQEIEREPIATQLRRFGGIYWTANWMELVERFAYYGVRTVLPVFMVLAVGEHGPQFTQAEKGNLFSIWALVQTFVPIFTGGFADRYGFKLNIGISTGLKIIGYLVMGYCVLMAEMLAGTSLSEARRAGTDYAREIFFVGAMFLALGTAIFKPGLQGLLAHQMPKNSAALGWGIFYQMVNIGGFIGPFLAGYLRVLDWTYVFLLCAGGIALNFIPLFFFREPEHHGDPATDGPLAILVRAVRGLLEPRLFFFTVGFAGFWLMFYQLFDILPNFIDEWIDSRAAASALVSFMGEGGVPRVNGGNLTQEWMINLNALLISFFAFAMGWATGRLRSLVAIVIGIVISSVAIYALGMSMNGWWILGAIALFSLGEMLASPTKMRYLASIAPPGKEGLYMGYVNMTVGIGWSIGSLVAGQWYEENGDKFVLARRYLVQHEGLPAAEIDALPKEEVMPFFERTLGLDAWQARELLWNEYEPYGMWLLFAAIGTGAMLAIVAYDFVTRRAAENPRHSFNVHGLRWVQVALVVIVAALATGTWHRPSPAAWILTGMFSLLLVASFAEPWLAARDAAKSTSSTDTKR